MTRVELRKFRADLMAAHMTWWFSGLPSAHAIEPIWRCLSWASA